MIIGRLSRDPDTDEITGTIEWAGFKAALAYRPNRDKAAPHHPDYLVYLNGADEHQAAAYWRTIKDAKRQEPTEILQTSLDAPTFAKPISFALWPERGGRQYTAIWKRPTAPPRP